MILDFLIADTSKDEKKNRIRDTAFGNGFVRCTKPVVRYAAPDGGDGCEDRPPAVTGCAGRTA